MIILMCILFLFWSSDEYRIKPVEEVKYMKNGGEDDQKIAARNQENLVRVEHYYLFNNLDTAAFCL